MKSFVILLPGILCSIYSLQVSAASDDLKSLLDKTAALIDTLDETRFPVNSSRIRFSDDCSDRLDCRRALLRLQVYVGDSNGADRSVRAVQKEVGVLKDAKRQNEFRLFLTDSLSRLRRYADAVEVMKQIDDPASKIQAVTTIADLFFDDKSATGIDVEPIVKTALEESVTGNFPDKEAVLAALHGIALAQMKKNDEAKTRFQQAYNAVVKGVGSK